MRALELTTRPLWFNSLDGTCYAGTTHEDVVNVDFEVYRKRFTDTELAAEVFRAAAWIGAGYRAHRADEGRNIVFEAAFTFGPITRDEHEYLTVHRFAALPHHDEAQP